MKECAHRKPVRASGEIPITLVDTDLNLILLEKGRSLVIPSPNHYAAQNAFYSSGRIYARGTQDAGKRLSPLDFISFRTSRGTDQSR
jgi:hypothetical protein